jgi:hypothetical protein
MQIQPSQAKAPLTRVTVRALEVRAAGLSVGGHVPAAATFVGDQGKSVAVAGTFTFCHDLLHEFGVGKDRAKTVGDGESGAAEFFEGAVEVLVLEAVASIVVIASPDSQIGETTRKGRHQSEEMGPTEDPRLSRESVWTLPVFVLQPSHLTRDTTDKGQITI